MPIIAIRMEAGGRQYPGIPIEVKLWFESVVPDYSTRHYVVNSSLEGFEHLVIVVGRLSLAPTHLFRRSFSRAREFISCPQNVGTEHFSQVWIYGCYEVRPFSSNSNDIVCDFVVRPCLRVWIGSLPGQMCKVFVYQWLRAQQSVHSGPGSWIPVRCSEVATGDVTPVPGSQNPTQCSSPRR